MAASVKNKTFDYLIVGSGIEALLTGLTLQERGQKGALIEKDEHVGGLYRPLRYQEQLFEAHLTFWPNTEVAQQSLELLQKWIPELAATEVDQGAITFHNGQVQPFLGFGEHHVPAADEYSFFTQSSQLQLNMSTAQMLQILREKYAGEVMTQNEVTQLTLEPETALTLNGSHKVLTKEIYYFENPQALAKLLSQDTAAAPLSKAAVQKLSKVHLWTAVNLVFHHTQEISQTTAMHVLYGAKEQPCIGRLSTQNGLAFSQWLCFLSDETAMDSEAIGATIREMKKQIKRMYPSFTDTVEKEVILVHKQAYGMVPANFLDKNRKLAKTPNLHLGSRFYTAIPGIVGDIYSALPLTTDQVPHPEGNEAVSPEVSL